MLRRYSIPLVVKAVTVDDVNVLIEQFKPGDFTQLSIGPAQDS
jgi:hypothetical protein